MKQFRLLKPIWLAAMLLLLSSVSLTATAYDFMVDGLCYNKNSDGTSVTVTYQNTSSPRYSNLSGNLVIPARVYYSGRYYSVTSIGDNAFRGCTGLTSVTIPNSVTSIGDVAFQQCYGLTSVIIGNSVTSIGHSAFAGCSGLTSFTIPNSVTSIGSWAFEDCSGLTSVTIGNSVTSIGDYAFSGCSGLTSVTIPNSVTSIGSSAFSGCSGLTSVTIPNSVTSIGGSAFRDCSGLTSVTIGNSVTSIGNYAFYECSSLTSVTIPNSVTSIGQYAFYGCSCLTSFTIPNSVTSIGDFAFAYCWGPTSVTIPNSVTSIGPNAFYDCTRLTSVHITDLAAWCNIAFGSSNSNPLNYAHHLFLNGKEVKDLVIPNSVTSIGNYAFSGCSGLTSVTIPNSVTSIGFRAFYNCSGLTSIYTHIKHPSDVELDTDVFSNIDKTKCVLHVPSGRENEYRNANQWKDFMAIVGDIDNNEVIESFETMPATTNTSVQNMIGCWANWSFTKCNVDAPGGGMCNGSHAVAMKLPSLIASSDTYYDARSLSAEVFNTTNTDAKLTLAYSTDGGENWITAKTATNATAVTIQKNSTDVASWTLSTDKDVPTRYRIQQIAGNKNSPIYLDDITLFYTAKGTQPQRLEDFETMPTTTNTSAQDVEGRWANWSFTKCNIEAPGIGMCNGSHAVAMKLPSLIASSDTYYDAYSISAQVFNTTNTDAKLTLTYSTDRGTTWTTAKTTLNGTAVTVKKNSTDIASWSISTNKNVPTRYRIQQTAGDKNNPIYLDDVTLYYTPFDTTIDGDVNGDGKVNVSDVTALINMILGVIPKDMERADVNGDGKINVSDVTALVNIILGVV